MNTQPPPAFCLLTVPQTCAPVDAIVCTKEAIITVQVAVSYSLRYRAGPNDFERIHAQLPVLFGETRRWCHVFVTGDEENAVPLRYVPTKDLPADLNIYSAVFDLGRLSSIRERLGELIEERIVEIPNS